MALLTLPSIAYAQDANRNWDANSSTPGNGGTGTWDTSGLNWSPNTDGTSGPYDRPWENSPVDNAIFGGTAGTVTLGVPITAHNLTFNIAGYTLTGNTLTLSGTTTPTISVNTAVTGTATISSVLAGTNGLTKTGGGVLFLNGANTFSGGITLSGGTLRASNNAALGAAGPGGNVITTDANATLTIDAGTAADRTVSIGAGTTLSITAGGAGSALYTGSGNLSVGAGTILNNDNNDFTGTVTLNGIFGVAGNVTFTSVRNVGQASSLGAGGTITFERGDQQPDNITYSGVGNTSNRDWVFNGGSLRRFNNSGSGALTLSGGMSLLQATEFNADTGDFNLQGVISGTGAASFTAGSGRTITLGTANSFTGNATISGAGVVVATALSDSGVNSSLGAGSNVALAGTLSYTGSGASSNRTWTSNGLTAILNNGLGSLNLTNNLSFVAGGTDTLTLGGSSTGTSTFSGEISGVGGLTREGSGVWELTGANTYSGATTVSSGTLRAGSAGAFGATTGITVNGGTLDLNGFALATPTLNGTGGTVALGSAVLTVSSATNSSYAGSIVGTGGLTKLGAGTLTLTGASTYTGGTTVGGGTLALDFSPASGPASDLLSSASALTMGGGTLAIMGAAGEANSQTFNGLTITGGNNTIRTTSGAAGSLTLNLGTITRTGGLANFVLPGTGAITTANVDGALGGWATVNGADYAKVVGGNIVAFTDADYTDQDDASLWANGQFISDSDGDADSFFGTVGSSVQLGGLQFTTPDATTTVTIAGGQTLGVDGSIIVAPSVLTDNQTITGGNLTGTAGGGVLGVQQNGAGTLTIASQIVDNTGTVGFTKSGTGRVVVSGSNSYTGATTVAQGTLSVNSIGNGNTTSAVGASTADASNLVIQGAALEYTGGTTISDRGFTLTRSGATTAGTISITGAAANLTFSGQVTSPDAAGLTKIGDGTLTLTNAGSDYTGITTISDGTLAISSIGNGGGASTLGASSAASTNLVLQTGGELEYTGGTASTNRGFTLGTGGGAIDVSQGSTTLTVSGVAAGTGTLSKNGAGTLILSGVNTYSGGTIVDAGILRAGSTQAFGTGTMTVNAGGTLDVNNQSLTVGSLAGSGTVTNLGTSALTLSGGTSTFSGVIGGSGALIRTGAGFQTFSGCNNTYTGATTINSGTISTNCLADGSFASGIGASGNASSNLVFIGGRLTYTGANVSIDRGFTLESGNNFLNVNDAAASLEFEGVVTGAGTLNKEGAGTLVLSGANTHTGNIRVFGGVLRAGADNAFGPQGYMTLDNTAGVLLDLNDNDAVVTALIGGGANGGNIDLGSGTLTIAAVDVRSYAGAISGTGDLVMTANVNNAGRVQELTSCSSTYDGTTTVSSGVLAVSCLNIGGAASSIGDSAAVASNLVIDGGTLRYIGAGGSTDRLFTLGASSDSKIEASGTGALAFTNTGAIAFASPGTAQTIRLGGTNTGNNSFALQITNNAGGVTSFTKEDAGTWRLSNAGSTYTGVTSILGGVLSVDKLANGGFASSIGQSALDATNLVIGSGSTLRYTGAGDSTNRLFTLQTGVTFIESSGTGAIAFTNTGIMGFQGSGTRIFALGGTNTGINIMGVSITDGTGGSTTVAKNDSGNWYLTGNSTYTGPTNVNAGTLFIGNGGTTGSITSSIVNVTGFGALGFNRSDTVTYAGTIQGSGGVTQAGTGTTILTGNSTYTGGTTISAGTLQLGNGGTAGSIVGNVTNNGALAFNRNNAYTFGGTISGTGVVRQSAGTLSLTGNNSYTGATDVTGGTLLVNGDQSAATGATAVAFGATLGGTGIIGGNVTLADGATLAAGSNGVGTLTINGNLALSAGSVLDFEFGEANVAGGSLNDLVEVGGDLALDGTINVTVPAGGSFGPGIYRVFNYGGALTDNGLTLGTMPGGIAVSVQTAIAGQVNLVNTAGLTLSFWDGNAGPKNDGTVNGGDGVWRIGGGSRNWTDQNGAINADYAQDSFAIFSAAPGTVAIDDVGGNVQASGLQFASGGYTITGDALTLTGGQAIVQVGDGSAASAGYTATIASELTGTAGLVKIDAGTLVLTAANSYAGGTTINGGTLQIGNGGATGSITGDIDNNGALVVNRSGALTLDGTISGSGSLTKTGSSVLTLTGTNSYSGGTLVDSGTVQISSDANLGDVAGTLSLQGGTLQAGASFTSARNILLGSPDSNSIDSQGFDVTLTGTIGDGPNNSAGNFVNKLGSGTLTLTGTNTYNNRTVIAGGTLALAGAGTIGSGNLVVASGTVFDISQTDVGARIIQLNSGSAGTIALGSKTLTLGFGNSFSDWSGTITDGGIGGGTGGSVVIAAPNGAVRFFEANSYTGGTTVAAGTLALDFDGSLYAGGAVTVNAGAAFAISGLAGTGTTIGDLAGAGTVALGGKTLTFGTANDTVFSGAITGTGGALVKNGTGIFTLSGTNSYTGATDVTAGTLLVNGNQSAATGLTSVASGATLGGTGTIGGDVIVADGATLAPGAGRAGALTINGDLSLGSGSSLAFEFGRANAPGDPLNDVVNVGGDLTLDGTLNVAVTPGGTFDIGLYRIANYNGTLTDNGLALGTLPAGADVFVQTAVANQVNLINVGGATLNFWDGAAGPKFNGAVDGGSGVWQNGSSNDNWADATGAVNAGYDDGAFAIFTGAAGTVTVDNGLGAVTASGLQFAVDGYTIAGDALTLTGPQSVVRVGDGTVGGAGYTATIGAELTGAAQLVKTDLGTLVLTGTNSYTGGTAINGGTVRISVDANLGAAAGGLSLNGGTLNTTADLSSGRAVELAGAGTFLTDAGTTLTLGGAVTGAGSLTKSGAGTLALTGTGTYAGATSVTAGTLLVNGNYAGATGATSVASGASLGGTGTIGSDVTLADGATLTPGAGGAGTLTVNGDLLLAAGTTLAYEFGAANVAGGALNDLVSVGGDLVLDGTINVTVPAGGAFDVGVYRVFNYGGTLTNNGLTLGTLPGGSNVEVQTSIAGQVNLVNSAGLTINFWDGAAGPKNNGVINGGTGTWQASGGNDNWTDASGNVNTAYSDGAFAVFGGTGGTVTVDNGLGQVTTAGMQFAANGYTITGGGVALTGPQSTIRVGDGSTAGAGFTATVNAVLSGDTQLVKADAGTLILGGTNSYTGGTAINGGTVQISADANLGAASGNVTLDGGTLATSANVTSARDIVMAGAGTISTASGTTFTFNGLLSGTGALTNRGGGTLLLTGNSSGFAGSTRVEGTMIVNGSLCGDVNVAAGGRLGGTGTVCTTVNAGTVAPGNSIGTLTVAGTYTGSDSVLEIETELGGDASPTDRLVVTNGTAGSTTVEVINVGGLGAQTVEGIKIVDVTGGSSAGTFTLRGDYSFEGSPAVIAGAFGYRLYHGGAATPTDGDWYLRSALLDAPNAPQAPLYQPGVPLYESYAGSLQTLNRLGTLQERVGNRQWSGFTQGGVGMWGRIEGTRHRPEAAFSTSGTDVDTNSWQMQVGFDKALLDGSAGTLIGGINGRYGTADAHVRSRFGNGEIDTKGYGVGATVTWYDSTGFYADAQAQVSWYRSDLDSTVLGELIDDNHGSGEAFSLEVGKRAPLGGGLSVTPQIQMAYSNVRFDSFADPNGAAVSSDRADSLRSRWGISVDHQQTWDGASGARQSHLYGIVNLNYEWLDGAVADVSGTPIARRDDRLWGEVGIGGSYSWSGGRFTIFSEVSAETAINNFGDSNSLRGNAGFRMRF
ncbi:autotransporter-associated beta strand repeat-containing protein [Sphingomonas sp. DT-207]|uniref:autotransporter-associated beta strand repeat-containing protein n=1 Tax=Sphingomonas sp. DT-207 TaxID=3396167 RepID=UPI003F1B97A2